MLVPCRLPPQGLELLADALEARPHHLSERGQLQDALSPKERSTQLRFQPPDRDAHRRLRDAAKLRGAGEAALLAECQKAADLIQFHDKSSRTNVASIRVYGRLPHQRPVPWHSLQGRGAGARVPYGTGERVYFLMALETGRRSPIGGYGTKEGPWPTV
jgi:hypothetical protein